MMKTKRWLFVSGLLALFLVLAACTPAQTLPDTGLPDVPAGDVPAAAEQARQALADQLGISVESIEIAAADQVDWPDACLGLGGPDQVCAQVVTPGWRITLQANGEEYVFRTDRTGAVVERVPQPDFAAGTPPGPVLSTPTLAPDD